MHDDHDDIQRQARPLWPHSTARAARPSTPVLHAAGVHPGARRESLGEQLGPRAGLQAGAAAGGAYYARDHLNQSYSWLMDHMKYVGNLWDEASLEQRVEALCDIEEKNGVIFRKFVTLSRVSDS